MTYAIFAKDSQGKLIVLPERYRTLADAKAAWGYAVIRGQRPQRIETVRS